MRIESIRIRNLRGIKDTTVELDPKLTVLVGANNAGKTTVLDAIAAVLTYRRNVPCIIDTDFRAEHEGADVRRAAGIVISLRIVPTAGTAFEPGETGKVIQPSVGSEGEYVCLEFRAGYSVELKEIESTLVQLDPEGNVITEPEGLGAFPLRELLPFRAFGPERELRRGMSGRWSCCLTLPMPLTSIFIRRG